MGLFGVSNEQATDEVENATTEKNIQENWGLIISICDKAGKNSEEAKTYLRLIVKRLGNQDPHVAIKAITLLDACIQNCGKTFHLEVASREFENEFMRLMTKAPKTVAAKLRESLKKWAENEFKSDTSLTLIPSLYTKLKNQGYDFSSTETPVKKTVVSKDPNVVESQEEAEQIAQAIELSLKETLGAAGSSPKSTTTSNSLYPTVNMSHIVGSTSGAAAPSVSKELKKVRALYDFEAAEDNELTFQTGEIIVLLDDSDANWWKGSNQRGEGLFPANFVTTDLSAEPEKLLFEKARKIQIESEVKVEKNEQQDVEINEEKIDRFMHLLHEADPTNPDKDTEEMLKLEHEVNLMGPLIDSSLEKVDRKHAQLSKLSADLVDALSLYHMLMREPQIPKVPFGYQPPTPNTMMYNGLPAQGHNMPPAQAGAPPIMHFPPQFMPQGPQPPPQHYPGGPGVMMMPGQIPRGGPMMGPPPGMAGPEQIGPQAPPPWAGYGPAGPPGTFPGNQGPPQSQASGQPPHFVSSSSHIMH